MSQISQEKSEVCTFKEVTQKPAEQEIQTDPLFEYAGLPFRGRPPHIKKGDPESLLPVLDWEMHVKVLKLNKPEDLKLYEDVSVKVVKKRAMIVVEERKYVEQEATWQVLLKWGEPFYRNRTKEEKARMMS